MEISLMSSSKCSVSMPVLYLSSWWAQSLYILCSIFFTSGTCATWLTVLQLRILQWGEQPTWNEHSWVFKEVGLQLDLAFPDHSMLNFHLSHPCCWGLGHKKNSSNLSCKDQGVLVQEGRLLGCIHSWFWWSTGYLSGTWELPVRAFLHRFCVSLFSRVEFVLDVVASSLSQTSWVSISQNRFFLGREV